MCWSNTIAIPLVLKKPLRVYKVGTSMTLGNFISLYQSTWYNKHKVMPTVKINPEFLRVHFPSPFVEALWDYDRFYIYEGYHSYITKKIARCNRYRLEDIGIFEIPAGATIYVNHKRGEVVSTDIKYLGLLES